MSRSIVAGALIWLVLVLNTAGARADTETRIALVVGNGAYQYLPRLDNPPHDAQLIAATLKGLGFALIGGKEQTDLDHDGLTQAIRDFGSKLAGGSVGLFYYAGHGVQVGGTNYLVPVGANPAVVADVASDLINAELVVSQMAAVGPKFNLVMLDACRNNPFAGGGLRGAGVGLAQMEVPKGTLISYATQPGDVALDGTSGHSPYTLALAGAMQQPDMPLFDVFNAVGLKVNNDTGGQQLPWWSSSAIDGNFYFLGTVKDRPPYYQAWPTNFLQPEARDPTGKITVEAAMIHVVACDGGPGKPPPIYVYEYAHRLGFRAILPPNWGAALGGHDYASFAEAATAGCASVNTAPMK